jgi:hypothetical protein
MDHTDHTTPDTRAVVRAFNALAAQVRRLANIRQTDFALTPDADPRTGSDGTPDDHHVTHNTPTRLTTDWARARGYQVAATGAGTGAIALILQRGDDLLVCNLPAHLHWDGQRITLT